MSHPIEGHEYGCEHQSDEPCDKCCEHDDICEDERVCLICGKDMTEDLSARAYDQAKDQMKYGDD